MLKPSTGICLSLLSRVPLILRFQNSAHAEMHLKMDTHWLPAATPAICDQAVELEVAADVSSRFDIVNEIFVVNAVFGFSEKAKVQRKIITDRQ